MAVARGGAAQGAGSARPRAPAVKTPACCCLSPPYRAARSHSFVKRRGVAAGDSLYTLWNDFQLHQARRSDALPRRNENQMASRTRSRALRAYLPTPLR